MQQSILTVLIGAIVGTGVISLITGEFQWGILIGLLVGISISEWIATRRKNKGEIETDERIENNSQKFLAAAFGLSNFLLLIFLAVYDLVLDNHTIEVTYLIYYLLAVFLICLFIAPAIIKRK